LRACGVRRAAAVAAVAVLALASSGCSAERTEANEIKLYYMAGSGDDRVFKQCIAPGTAGPPMYDNDVFTLPADSRTWNVLPDPGADTNTPLTVGSAPVVVDPKTHATRSGPQVVVWYTTDFFINWDCGWDWSKPLKGQKGKADSPIVQFWETVGRSAQLSSNDGDFDIGKWKAMLQARLVTVERDVLQQQTKRFDSDTLKDNLGDTYEQMEAALGPAFQQKLKEKLGGDFFCGTGFAGGKTVHWQEPVLDGSGNPSMDPVTKLPKTADKSGVCPPVRIDITNIDLANADAQNAADAAYVAAQQAKAAKVRADSDQVVAKLATDPNVMRLKEMENQKEIAEACARGANCTLIQGVGGGVNVNAGK
jgi:hypothetical protein